MNLGHYILDENNQPVETDLMTWARWLEDHRQVQADRVGDVLVSTVFLGLDHRFDGDGPPVLWETMIFGGPLDGYQDRYDSHENALGGHQTALKLARGAR